MITPNQHPIGEVDLVADIGGTHARFALLDDQGERHGLKTLRCDDFDRLDQAIEHYLATAAVEAGLSALRPRRAALAVATPISGDQLRLTNRQWTFSVAALRQQLGLERLLVINDFTALALALPQLNASQLRQVGAGEVVADRAKGLIGPGTGLGVAGVLPTPAGWVPLESEGGHVTYSPVNTQEAQLVEVIRAERGHVSAEALLSGQGLVNLFRAMLVLNNQLKPDKPLPTAADITQRALAGECGYSQRVMEAFCAMLGTVSGNLALTLGARGGVYLGGGIVPRVADYLVHSCFRERFMDKGRFRDYLAAIPCFIITEPYPAFAGLRAALTAPPLGAGVEACQP